jgi:hypothetical protein
VAIEDMLVVFGGCFLDRQCFSDVFVLLTRDQRWVKPVVDGDPPPAREGHTATLVGTHMYVYGGSSETGYLNDVYILDVEAPVGGGREVSMAWGRPDINTGSASAQPLGREGHTATLYQGRIYMIGGYTVAGHTNEVLVLDTGTLSWEHPRVGNVQPSPREGHTTVLYRSRLYVFGGFTEGGCLNDMYVFDLLTNSWEKAMTGGVAPPPRQDHAAIVSGHRMVVMAGCNFGVRKCFSDSHVFDLDAQTWLTDKVSNPDMLRPREDHTAALVQGRIVLFGGCFLADKCYADTMVLENSAGALKVCEVGAAVRPADVCSGHGKCRVFKDRPEATNVCVCELGFAGDDCARKLRCPNECSGAAHGTCMANGKCACKATWTGRSCDQPRKAPAAAAGEAPAAAAGALVSVKVPLFLGGYTNATFTSSPKRTEAVCKALSAVLKLPSGAVVVVATGAAAGVEAKAGDKAGVMLTATVRMEGPAALVAVEKVDTVRRMAEKGTLELQAALKAEGLTNAAKPRLAAAGKIVLPQGGPACPQQCGGHGICVAAAASNGTNGTAAAAAGGAKAKGKGKGKKAKKKAKATMLIELGESDASKGLNAHSQTQSQKMKGKILLRAAARAGEACDDRRDA